MYVIAWIVLGLVAGLLASRLANKGSREVLLYPLLGVAGAAIGGFSFELLATGGPRTPFVSIWSLLVSLVGAVTLLVAYRALRIHLSRR